VGEPDLLDVEAATVGEYDGSQHRELRQHTSDNVREEGFERLNLTVVRATALDLWPHRAQLLGRLRDGWQRGDRRDRSRDPVRRTASDVIVCAATAASRDEKAPERYKRS